MIPAEELELIERRLGYTFEDPSLLERGLTHSSWANEAGGNARDNERLEFLGDAVLELIVARWLFDDHPEAPEGVLTATRAYLVQEDSLAAVALRLDLGPHLRLGRGEELTGGRTKPSLLADAVEAVIAAIYLDGGFAVAESCVKRWLRGAHASLEAARTPIRDPRTELQERVQAAHGQTPRYRIVGRSGPDHAAVYRAEVEVPGLLPARGEGPSKKEAKRDAARALLERMGDGSRPTPGSARTPTDEELGSRP